MLTHADFVRRLDSLRPILLAFSREQSLQAALELLVRRLAEPSLFVAAAGVWLTAEICEDLGLADEEVEGDPSWLRLVASASQRQDLAGWRHAQGTYLRVPQDEPFVGRVAMSARPVMQVQGELNAAKPQWSVENEIGGYLAAPLLHRGGVLGVLALFSPEIPLGVDRDKFLSTGQEWLALLSDHTAAAVASAQAFAEIERLRRQLQCENQYLREEVSSFFSQGEFIGKSAALRKVLEQIDLVAPTDANVLIVGESGTGKELVARALHQRGTRADRPLIKVNCASVPPELFESEFFGHVKGAFTGALKDRLGRFQLADEGTLFLDEVGEIPPALQAKLLRVLQEGEFERVGDEVTSTVDTRIIAATNRDLWEEVEAKRFRQDLYYRLNVVPIEVPPLRERTEDIPALAEQFMEHACRRLGLPRRELKDRDVRELTRYEWPGNVRELQNVVERAIILSRTGALRFDLRKQPGAPEVAAAARPSDGPQEILQYAELKDLERRNVLLALEEAEWKVSGPGGAAERLGVKPTTLLSRMSAMKIRKRP